MTVGNSALRRGLAKKEKLGPLTPVELISVTGGKVPAEYAVTKQLRLGGVDVTSLPIAFADVHSFRQLDLMDRPAIILGMDALKLFNRVSLDFANRKLRLLPPERSSLEARTRLAEAGAPGKPRL